MAVENEGDGLVRIACQVCGESCLRNPQSGRWFHENDTVPLHKIFDPTYTEYDHQPAFTIIDVNPKRLGELEQ